MSPGLAEQAATASAAPSTDTAEAVDALAATEPLPSRPAGDLDTGAVTHSLPAGDRTVVIDWWTTQQATEWTAADAKTIELSAHVEGGETDQAITVTRFLATADDGTTRTTVSEDRGEFVLTPPFSYTSALSLSPSTTGTTTLTVYVQFDLLVETETESGRYFRQTVLDELELPLLTEASR